jgi:hypothetical protein
MLLQDDKNTPDNLELKKYQDILNLVKSNIEGKKSISDYESTILVLCKEESISYHHMGFAASILPLYNRILEDNQKIENARKNNTSHFLGSISDKITGLKVKLISQNKLESYYGINFLYNFQDDNGNKITWFASSNQYLENNESVMIKLATIKKLEEFRGVNQTVITRAKIEKIS